MAFLKLADPDAHKNYEKFHFNEDLNNEVFTLNHSGKKYKCQKYCPHAKADLSNAEVVDGNLICPRHYWKFSLKDGKCLNNNSKIIMELQK
jgi:nitrite reductase/ring-hydroxylating ferredoxin subunit